MSRERLRLPSMIPMEKLQHMPGGNRAADNLTQGLSIPITCIDDFHEAAQLPHQVGIGSYTLLLPAQEARHQC